MDNELIGVILAAGEGTRMYPKAKKMPKVLLEIDGRSLLSRTITSMRDALKINRICIIVGFGKEQIMDRTGDGSGLGMKIEYIYNPDAHKGLAHGIALAERHVNNPFCVMLADEVYFDSNHSGLRAWLEKDFIAVCGVKTGAYPHTIKKNYALEIHDGRISSLSEKPSVIKNDYLGCGTFLFTTKIFDYIRMTPVSTRTGKMEIADTLDIAAKKEKKVYPFFLEGEYINVNSWDDFNQAKYIQRSKDFDKKKISLIVPAYNEAESIGYVIDNFKGKVDEIVVADNSSADGTASIARQRGATVYTGIFKGYGDALKCGMEKASGDILILTEADGSFDSRDLGKILEYMKDADMVVGTRTTKQMIGQAANMGFLPRWGNVIVAKLLELLWWATDEPRLTDVGCTFRGIWKQEYMKIKDCLRSHGPEFSPEMIIEVMNFNMRLIEIPIGYGARLGGTSKFSGNLFGTMKTGLRMIRLIISKKIRRMLVALIPEKYKD